MTRRRTPTRRRHSARRSTDLSVDFDGHDSTAADGATITSYAWDFDDGESSTAARAEPCLRRGGHLRRRRSPSSTASGHPVRSTQTVDRHGGDGARSRRVRAHLCQRLGSADVGGTWSTVSGSSVAGGVGLMSLLNGQTRATTLSGDPAVEHRRPGQRLDRQGRGRWKGARERRAAEDGRGRVPGEAAVLRHGRRERRGRAARRHHRDAGRQPGPDRVHARRGATLDVRVRTVSTGPSTTLQVKVWPQGQPEPVDWYVTATDSDPGLQGRDSSRSRPTSRAPRRTGPLGLGFDHLSVVGGRTEAAQDDDRSLAGRRERVSERGEDRRHGRPSPRSGLQRHPAE